MNCRGCTRPADLHCPGCSTCCPGDSCPPTCDATPEEVAAAARAVEQWEDTEPRDRHTLSCPVWQSDDPADGCDCDADLERVTLGLVVAS